MPRRTVKTKVGLGIKTVWSGSSLIVYSENCKYVKQHRRPRLDCASAQSDMVFSICIWHKSRLPNLRIIYFVLISCLSSDLQNLKVSCYFLLQYGMMSNEASESVSGIQCHWFSCHSEGEQQRKWVSSIFPVSNAIDRKLGVDLSARRNE